MFGSRLWKQIASKLFDRKSVKWFVVIERIDYIVSKGSYRNRLIAVVSNTIRVTNEIQPPHGHPLTKLRRLYQFIDQLFVCFIAWIDCEAFDPFWFRR